MTMNRTMLRVIIAVVVAQMSALPALAGKPVFPGKTWAVKTPAEVGLDKDKLKAFSDYLGGRGCVTRGGVMVYTWGNYKRRGDVASACKPWYSHFLFKALEDGKIPSLDEKIVKYEPRLKDINKDLGYKDRDITWRHVANQISCYGLVEKPGAAYAYNDWQMAMFWDCLFKKVYGATYKNVDAKVLQPLLTKPLQCEDAPTMMVFGVKNRPGRVGVSPRDFCRLGLLYLHKGNWRGKQLISEKHAVTAVTSPLPLSIPRAGRKAAEMIPGQRSIGSRSIPDNQCDHDGGYSWLWWINGIGRDGKRNWPDVPTDAYGAFGHAAGKRALVVIPSLDIVVSWNDTLLHRKDKNANGALKLLVASVTDTRAGPAQGQIAVSPKNPRWLVRYDAKGKHKPFFMCGPGDPEGFLYRGKRNADGTRDGDQTKLIAKLKPTGANCIYLMAVRSHGGDGEKTHNPFIDNDPAKGLNLKVLDQWEKWFAEMDKSGIVIFFFFYDDSARIWKTGDKVGPAERKFLRGLVKRFKHHRNLIWCVAEEYQERFSVKRVSNIAAEIRAADEFAHPIAVHKLSGLDFSEFADDPNIDQFAVQYGAKTPEDLHAGLLKAWKKAGGRYNLNMSEVTNHGVGAEARKKNWACAMAGAYVMIIGMDIASTPVGYLNDCGRLVKFFESTNFHEMTPHDELVAGDTEYVLAKPGEAYIAYSSKRTGKIGLKGKFKGAYTLTWMDCATGKSVIQSGVKVSAVNPVFSPPAGFGKEVAVYIRTRPASKLPKANR